MILCGIFYRCRKRVLGNGKKTLDSWIGRRQTTLCQSSPRLYNLCYNHDVIVHSVHTRSFDCLKFRRFLREETKEMWLKLLDLCSQVNLSHEPDRVTWLLTKSGNFSLKSLYFFLAGKRVNFPYKKMWNLKLPLRV